MKIVFLPQSEKSRDVGELSTIVIYNISLVRSSLKKKTWKQTFEVEPGCYKDFTVVCVSGMSYLAGLGDFENLDVLSHSE